VVASFDFVPRSAAPTSAPHVVAVSKSGDIELSVVRDSPRHQWSSRGELAASSGRRFKFYRTHAGIEGDPTREPWDIPIDDDRSPADRPTTIGLDDGTRPDRDAEHHTLQIHQGSKYSPSIALPSSTSTDRKAAGGSAVSTPRPSLTPLDDEASGTGSKVRATTPTKTPVRTPKALSLSRARSSRRSERYSAERGLAQDISAIIRRRVLHGYGLESVSGWFM
jgi:hypothetical protein